MQECQAIRQTETTHGLNEYKNKSRMGRDLKGQLKEWEKHNTG